MVETWPPQYDEEGRLHRPLTESAGAVAYQFCCSCVQLWPCPTVRRLPDYVAARLARHCHPTESEARGG